MGNTLVGNSIHWEEKVEMGKGRNFGIEFMLEKKTGPYYRPYIQLKRNVSGKPINTTDATP